MLKPEPAPQPAAETAASPKPDSVTGAGDSAVKTANASGSRAGTQTAESAPEIRKAIPVQPQDKKPVEIRRAIPVKPLDQEGEDETLLKQATPAPSDE
jgi:Asp/Glu/hydantoin racemase